MVKLANRSNCTGCTACMSICPKQCISMERDEDYFVYPQIDLTKCINCGACERVCPIFVKKKCENELPKAFAAYSTDESIRMDSSSGGVFSEIAKYILEKRGVVYGATYNQFFEVCHIGINNINDLSKLRGAKYAQSNLGITFKEILEKLKEGQLVLFSGTPCQVAGLKNFIGKDYDNLICVDFVCHGVPSPLAWKEYLKYQMREENEETLPISVNLRDKSSGWSRYRYSNVFQYPDGNIYISKSDENLFMKLFVSDYINRVSCSQCQFKGYSRLSDFTLGDFWGIWDIDPKMDDDKGTSAVLIQSIKGKKVWEKIQQKLIYRDVTLKQVSQQNPSLLVSSQIKEQRELVLDFIRNGKIDECQNLFAIPRKTFLSKIKEKWNILLK